MSTERNYKLRSVRTGRLTKEQRGKRSIPKPNSVVVRVPAWLSRCATMGYEIWSDKPELREDGCFRQLLDWKPVNESSFYYRLPLVDGKAEGTNIYLHEGTTQRIWLTVDISKRTRRTQDEVKEDELQKAASCTC